MRIEDLMIILITILLSGVSLLLMFRDMKENILKDAKKEKNGDGVSNIIPKGVLLYSIGMIMLTLVIAVVLQRVYKDNSFIFNLKRICLLSILWPVALIDFQSCRIPNEFIIFGLICRVLLILPELFWGGRSVGITILTEITACGAIVLAAVLCRFCIKNSIGAGDIKLFLVMGLLLGLDGIWGAIFMALVVSFFISVILIITKKKTRKDTIPFGPAIVIGTYLSVFFTGM